MKEYIDREALWRAMQSIIEDPTCPLHIAATVDQYITEAPAADVVERKRGEWIEHKWAEEENGLLISNFECSACHEWERETSDFCPNCGADMRGNNHETDIEAQPTVDAVEVVRCKDCKCSGMYAFGYEDTERLACLDVEEDGFIRFATAVDPDGYCSKGERRNPNDHP